MVPRWTITKKALSWCPPPASLSHLSQEIQSRTGSWWLSIASKPFTLKAMVQHKPIESHKYLRIWLRGWSSFPPLDTSTLSKTSGKDHNPIAFNLKIDHNFPIQNQSALASPRGREDSNHWPVSLPLRHCNHAAPRPSELPQAPEAGTQACWLSAATVLPLHVNRLPLHLPPNKPRGPIKPEILQ